MEDLLLRICTAALQELADVRERLREANDKIASLDARSAQLSSASGSAPDAGDASEAAEAESGAAADRARPGLPEALSVQDDTLRRVFADACGRGEPWIELKELLRLASDSRSSGEEGAGGEEGAMEEATLSALREELRSGAVRSVLHRIDEGGLACAERGAEVAEAALARKGAESEDSGFPTALVFAPVFREGGWPVVEALLRLCRRERLTPTLQQLHISVRSLIHDEVPFRDIDVLGVLRSAPPGVVADARVVAGRAVVRYDGEQDASLGSVALYIPADEACVGQEDMRELVEVSDAVSGCFDVLEMLSQGSDDVDVLQLLAPLRSAPLAAELGLPQSLALASAGALQWAFDRRAAKAAAPEPMPAVPRKAMQAACPASPSNGATKLDDQEGNGDEDGEGDEDGQEDGEPREKSFEILEQQAAFLACFKEDLNDERPLLLSQLNNLYKMRSGEELHRVYKEAGFEKLRDFLLDIPGLSLVGRGNHMQVQLGETEKLQEFQDQLHQMRVQAEAGGISTKGTPQFWKPNPLPEKILAQIHTLFANMEGNEIPLRSFIATWNAYYSNETLAYRTLGFRDVRGLLSQVNFIEKVGGKSGAKYVLKPGCEPPAGVNGTAVAHARGDPSQPARHLPAPLAGMAPNDFDGSAASRQFGSGLGHQDAQQRLYRPPAQSPHPNNFAIQPTGERQRLPPNQRPFQQQPLQQQQYPHQQMQQQPQHQQQFRQPQQPKQPQPQPQQQRSMGPPMDSDFWQQQQEKQQHHQQQPVPDQHHFQQPQQMQGGTMHQQQQAQHQHLQPHQQHYQEAPYPSPGWSQPVASHQGPGFPARSIDQGKPRDPRSGDPYWRQGSCAAGSATAEAHEVTGASQPYGQHRDYPPSGMPPPVVRGVAGSHPPEAWRGNRPGAQEAWSGRGGPPKEEVWEQSPQPDWMRGVGPGTMAPAEEAQANWKWQPAADGDPPVPRGQQLRRLHAGGWPSPHSQFEGTAQDPSAAPPLGFVDNFDTLEVPSHMGAVSSVFQPEGEPGVRTSTLDNTYFARGTHPPAAAAPSAPLRHLQSPHQSGFQPAAEEMYWLDELIKVQEGEQRELDAALEAPAQDVDAQLKAARELSNSGMPTSSGDEDVPRELNPGALVQRRQRGNRHGVKAGFFVSSPGAFVSTDTRDGGRYVSKVDRESTLHSQLPVGIPSLVCDIFSSKIMTTNAECNDLFECDDPSGQMMQMEFFHFVHEDDRDQVSQTMAYLLVSGHSELGEEAFKILTLQGKTRLVRMKGTSLSGTWWQLVFQWDCQPGAAAASSSS